MDSFFLALLQRIIDGISSGSIIALAGIGLSLTYGILNFSNFAHGDYMALGAYIALFFVGALHFPLWLALIFAIAINGSVSVGVDVVLYRPLRKHNNNFLLVISSIGVAIIIRALISLLWGNDVKRYSSHIYKAIHFGMGFHIKPTQILIIVTLIFATVSLFLFLRNTKIGKAMRAVSDNTDLALISGINSEVVIIWTWFIGIGLTTIGGVLLGLDVQLRPQMGWEILLPIFAAVILGKIGKPFGALVGGLIIGISAEVSTMFISSAYKNVIPFAIIIIALIFMPQGIFGKKIRIKK